MYFVNSVSLHAFHLINLLKYLLEGIGIIGLSYDHCIKMLVYICIVHQRFSTWSQQKQPMGFRKTMHGNPRIKVYACPSSKNVY